MDYDACLTQSEKVLDLEREEVKEIIDRNLSEGYDSEFKFDEDRLYRRVIYFTEQKLANMMIEKTNPAIRSCETILYNFYQETFVKNNKGYGSALVVWCVILIAIITAVQFIGQKKWVTYDV